GGEPLRVPPSLPGPHPHRPADVVSVVVAEEAVLYRLTDRSIAHLNPSATQVWRNLDGTKRPEETDLGLIEDLTKLGFVAGEA
ncbi:MAG: hypothetical protein KDB69_05200, partial [Acidimicrobiia bacterium]|nr:hypothetical protein [Acidimicrobiia bacterium]